MNDIGAGILVDTSVARQYGSLHGLCELAKRVGVPVYVSAITYGEMLRHLRAKKGESFTQSTINGALGQLGLQVLSVDTEVAQAFAESTHAHHATDEEWNRAKQSQCISMLGLHDKVPVCDLSPKRHCSGTADWFIAATAVAYRLLMVTEDTGPEFTICSKTTIKQATDDLAFRAKDLP